MNLRKWLTVSLIGLLLVAAMGVVLRYKIAYSLTFIEQRKLLHAHSHFAFSGWVSQALMALMIARLSVHSKKDLFKRYNRLLWANLVCSYGMLISFLLQGYAFSSIFFSTCALIVSYVFMGMTWRDIRHCQERTIIKPWFKAATFFNALSSLGALSLAYMMVTKNMHQNLYLAAVYFFLHFQYNGWFSFTVLGLLSEKLQGLQVPYDRLNTIFRMFVLACIPAYFLSALWMPIPAVVYWMVVVAALLQAAGWFWLVKLVKINTLKLRANFTKLPYTVIILSLVAFSIKYTLQLGSVIPSLSKLAFGFRPIVIGYLHLVLLGCTSLFIIGYALHTGTPEVTPARKVGLTVFISGIILNELVLMVQGLAAMYYVSLPYVNEVLLCVAAVMFTGIAIINIRMRRTNNRLRSAEPAQDGVTDTQTALWAR